MQLIKYKIEMFLMLCDQVTGHKYIIQIYMYKSYDIISENNSHEPLKCSSSVIVSLLHSMAHECAIGGKHCLSHIRHIDLRSIFPSSYIVMYLLLVRDRGNIFLFIIIVFAFINDSAKFHTGLLEDAKHWCCLGDVCLFQSSGILIHMSESC